MSNAIGKILYAIVARLNQADINNIIMANKAAWFAQANYGIRAQAEAQEHEQRVCVAAVENMLASDREYLAKLVGGLFSMDELFDLEYAVNNLIQDKRDYCANEEGNSEAVEKLEELRAKIQAMLLTGEPA